MARRRRGVFTVGLPRPGPNAEAVWQHWRLVVQRYAPTLATRYLRGITSAASSELTHRRFVEKLAAWYSIAVPRMSLGYSQVIAPVRQEYKRVLRERILPELRAIALRAPA